MFGKGKEEKEKRKEEKAQRKIEILKEKENLRKEKTEKKVLKSKRQTVKLKRDIGIKVFRIIIWGILLLFTIRGVVAVTRPNPINEMVGKQKDFENQIAKNNIIESRSFSFAESFAREYFTLFDGKHDDYKNRLREYMQKDIVEKVDTKGCMQVESVQAYDLKRYSENQLDVFVHAIVIYNVEVPGQDKVTDVKNKVYDTSKRDVYIDIPIYYAENREMIVEDLPLIVAKPSIANISENKYIENDTLNGYKVNEIKDSLTEFFKAYYQETQTQVDYFLIVPGSIRGVNERYKFNSIEECSVYDLGNNKYKAVVTLKVEDEGKIFKQEVNLNITYKTDRYMIESLDTRGKNIK